ncbi:hypothetical protein LTS08_000067 [Lithohypha guttulata]|nr:hypothetical protein LTS08_000067 [Lithohypha guttulata]
MKAAQKNPLAIDILKIDLIGAPNQFPFSSSPPPKSTFGGFGFDAAATTTTLSSSHETRKSLEKAVTRELRANLKKVKQQYKQEQRKPPKLGGRKFMKWLTLANCMI